MSEDIHSARPASPRVHRIKRRLKAIAVVSVFAVIASGGVLHATWPAQAAVDSEAHSAVPSRPVNVAPGFGDLIARVKPAVVNVSTTGKVSRVGGGQMPDFQLPPGSPFEEFFRHFFQQQQGEGPPAEVHALGSGFIVDPQGWVVTNNHVIDGADEVKVILNDGTQYPAEVKGVDSKTDLALLKIDAGKPLPYVKFGDSDKTRVGDWVVAIGNPFGLGGTATAGIVSARGRDLQSGPFDDFLQIDAPINRGNSGGPLFDDAGNVIGINTAIYSPNGGSVGIGFAIPSDMAKPVIHQLRAHGSVERGWLGVQIQPVTPEVAESLSLPEKHGALVAGVVPDSPAEKAGLQTGDVIVAFNGDPLDRFKDLPRMVADTKAGETVGLVVWRHGANQALEVTIGRMPEQKNVASAERGRGSGQALQPADQLGLALDTLTPEKRQHYRIPDSVDGVLVVAVKGDGPAARQGVRPGDVIVMVDQQKVSTPDDVRQTIEEAAAREHSKALLLVNRRGDQRFLAVDLA